jgi:acetyltransferase-like isoleucine patch superfamily enzyme
MTSLTENEKAALIDPALSCIRNTQIGVGVKIYPFTNIYGSNLADGVVIGPFVELGGAIIGKNTKISSHTYICPGCVVGEECFIGHGVLTTNDLFTEVMVYEKLEDLRDKWRMRKTKIGNRVRIGSGAVLLPVEIGDGAIIGAGCVVVRDVAPGEIVAGVPGRVIGRTFNEWEY